VFRLGLRQLGILRDARSVEAVLHDDPDALDGGQIIDDALGALTRCLPFGFRSRLSHRLAGRLGRKLTLSRAAREATAKPTQDCHEHLVRPPRIFGYWL